MFWLITFIFSVLVILSSSTPSSAPSTPNDGTANIIKTLSDCSPQKQFTLRKLMNQNDVYIISSLDGKVTAVDLNNGQILWSYMINNDGLFMSTIGNFQFMSDALYFKLVPALDGSLYKLNEQHNIIEPVPLNAEVLLKSSFKLGDDLLINGGREVKTYAIDLFSGKLLYSCGISDCKKFQKNQDNNSESNIILIRQLRQKVRAINPRSGEEEWKFDVGENMAYLLSQPHDDCHVFDNIDQEEAGDQQLSLKIPDGHITMANKDGEDVWSIKLNSPIVTLWRYHAGKLNNVDIFNFEASTRNKSSRKASLYIGVHQDQIYIQHSDKLREKYRELGRSPTTTKGLPQKYIPQLDWKKPDDSSLIVGPSSNALVQIPSHGAFIYLESNDQCNPAKQDKFYNLSVDDLYNETREYSAIESIEKVLIFSFKQVFMVSGMIAILLNIFVSWLRKFWKKRYPKKIPTPATTKTASTIHDAVTATEQAQATVSEVTSRARSSESGSDTFNFISWYSTHFEPISCLGKGGFGVVFEARNKIDDCLYAIKRINLPLHKSSREKVMREVRALATLDHQGIVRYYNSWLESPPDGWQSEHESILIERSSFMSTETKHDDKSNVSYSEKDSLIAYNPLQSSEKDSYVVFERSSGCVSNDCDDEDISREIVKQKIDNCDKEECDQFSQAAYLYIQMQLCQKTTLREWLKTNHKRDKQVIFDYFYQIVDAVDYVHSKQLMHRDLKVRDKVCF